MNLIGYQQVGDGIINSEGASIGLDAPLLDVLYYLVGNNTDQTFCLVKKASEFAAPIMGLLDICEVKDLWAGKKVPIRFNSFQGGMDVFLLKYANPDVNPWLSIKHPATGHESTFYTMSQYDYQNQLSLDPTPQELVSLGQKVVEAARSLGFYPRKFFSPISILSDYAYKLDIPIESDIEAEANVYAQRVGIRFWREAHTLGLFDNLSVFDLSSAYPNVHKTLLDTRNGKWVKEKGFSVKAHYGYCQCKVTIYDKVTISPILIPNPAFTLENEKEDDPAVLRMGSYIGSFVCYLTKTQIDFVHRWHIGDVEVIDGWYFYPRDFAIKPVASFIERLLKHKKDNPDPFVRQLAKMMVNQFWGYTRRSDYAAKEIIDDLAHLSEAERDAAVAKNKQFKQGKLHNSIWATEIVSQVNLKIADILYRRKIRPIRIATDSFACQEHLELTQSEIDAGWRNEYKGEVLVVSSGRVHYADRHPNSLTLTEMKEMIKEHPNDSAYIVSKERVTTLGESILAGDLSLVGKMRPHYTGLDLNDRRHSRMFKELPQSGRGLLMKHYPSAPFKVGCVEGQNVFLKQ